MASIPFPPLPSPQSELEQFLLSPQHLSIHNSANKQKIWPREPNPLSLLHIPICPTHSRISVQRDTKTGELLGYQEVEFDKVGLTAKNSTSLQRAPGPLDLSIKGDSTHFPFWPGGLDEPAKEILLDSEIDEIDFEKSSTDTLKISLQDLFNEAELDWFSSTQSIENPIEENNIDTQEIAANDMIDDLVEIDSARGPINVPQTPYKKRAWAINVNVQEKIEDFYEKIPNMAHTWPFELDNFQKQAILRLESQECVFVSAHTSAGKTVVAEYAIALSLSHKTKTIYTSPIKALSNQKFHDFRHTFGEENIGLVTGDVQIRKEAPCLIMTTEILRSMLYHGSDIIRDVEWVIFDEVHYINDSERGVVWEEVLILLPAHVNLILLSATVPNAIEFADWVGRTKQKNIHVISTSKRPVPLQHYLYTGNSKQTQDQLFMIVDEERNFILKGYKMALEAKKEKQPKFGAKGKSHVSAAQDKNVWLSLIYMLQKKDKLPLVAFTFSRKRCDENAKSLTNLDLTDGQEKHKINSFFEKSISILKGTDKQLPQVTHMKDLLKRGIGVHHSGILPIIKEIVEMLFGQGLVGLLFATETFAMGVNMPARTVAFDAISKYDGDKSSSRELYPGEYVQMAGRAGRRGKDTTGTVIILCKGDVHEEGELHKMILGKPTTLESQFRLTYSMLLNIMRVQTLRVQDVMKRSFAELDSMKNKIDRQEQLLKLEEKIGSLDNVLCSVCTQDIDKYYQSCEQYIKLQREMQKLLLENRNYKKSLTSGCVLIIWTNKYKHSLAILLQQNTISKKYTVLVLCNHGDHSEEAAISLTDFDENHITPYCELNELFVPENEVKYNVLDISGLQIIAICKNTITVNGLRLINEYKTSQFPRFKDRAPSPEMSKAVEILRQLSIAQFDDINVLDPISNLKVENMDYVEKRDKLKSLQKILPVFECIKCPLFDEHFGITRKKAVAKNELKQLRYLLSEESLLYLPEYQCKLDVLRHFGFISKDGTVTLKGRVACEIHTQEVILTEILFRNILRDFKPAEIAALLSCMVLQQENCSEPNYTENLTKGKKMILQIAEEIAEVEISCGLITSVEDYQKQFKFGLVEVVHEWANGKEFIEIVQMTDVMEGTIVKCVQRLDELCRDIAKAARTVGDPSLGVLMQEVSTLIRRDIIFAASLYTI